MKPVYLCFVYVDKDASWHSEILLTQACSESRKIIVFMSNQLTVVSLNQETAAANNDKDISAFKPS